MTTTHTTTHTAPHTADPPDAITRHLASGPRLVGDVGSFPSHAELARTLIEPGSIGALATLTETGLPYPSMVPFSLAAGGAPIICVSALAEHTQNLHRDPHSSLLVRADVDDGSDPMAAPRVTLLGTSMRHRPTDADIEHHLTIHPGAADYISMDDFSWWRLEITSLRYIGGFGVMGWSSGTAFASAVADPVMRASAPMIRHLNADHADSCVEIVRHLAGIDNAVEAIVTGVDRYGMTIDVCESTTPDDVTVTARVAFPEALDDTSQVRQASIALVQRARAAAGAPTPTATPNPARNDT